MRILPITGILLVVLAAGCSNGKKAVPESTAQAEPQATTAPAAQPPAPPVEPIAPVAPEPQPQAAVIAEPTRAEPGSQPETPPTEPTPKPSPPKVAAEKPAVSEPAPVAPAPAPAKPEAPPPPPAAKPSTPTLDVNALKEKLKETKAIGVFTKLTLKNQVDDLLQQFRAYYQAKQKRDIATLRQAYDMLVLKVLSLVQDGDPTLARTIAASREAIWAMLADPVKFNTLM